jgi:tetrahydromethanopterin S-methyltransferase subunit A
MTQEKSVQNIRSELETGISLSKCQKCGCMGSTLKNLVAVLPSVGTTDASSLADSLSGFLGKMHLVQYECLGCEHCYPAVAQNAFALAFPSFAQVATDLSCEYRIQVEDWPPVVGEYFALDKAAPVAVSTLASVQLAEEIAHSKPKGLAIVGKTETENIGIDKVIKNVISSPAIRYLMVAGVEVKGHLTGKTLLALAENGVDENGHVIGSPGKRPILRNVSVLEIQTFREKVQVIDMIGQENLNEIIARIDELSHHTMALCGCGERCAKPSIATSTVPVIVANQQGKAVKMDTEGYFVIVPLADRGVINVEHYSNDNTLLRVIEGTTARAIYRAIIDGGWITELSHAAYLGKELAKAEWSLKHGGKYVQEGA